MEAPRIVLFEGPQGSGKTSAANYLKNHGYQINRGIPPAEFLVKNSPIKNWLESILLLEDVINNNRYSVFDRSLWSLVAFHMQRNKNWAHLFFNLGVDYFTTTLVTTSTQLVFLDSSAENCMERNRDDKTLVSLSSLEEYKRECDTYNQLKDRLTNRGVKVNTIENNGDERSLNEKLIDFVAVSVQPS